MSLIDFIAFIAAMVFLLVSHISQSRAAKKNKNQVDQEVEEENLEEFEQQELRNAKKLQELINQRNKEAFEVKKWAPKPHPQQQKPQLQKSSVHHKTKSHEDNVLGVFDKEQKKQQNAYKLKVETEGSKAGQMIKKLKSPQDMIIINEILSKPKGF